MKKLIINEKNLPKLNKIGDSNIRIRLNKANNPHQSTTIKKSIPAQIQDIDICLETLEKSIIKNIALDEQKSFLLIQILKQYKQILNPNQQLMTQSLKFSKLKFKTIIQVDEKQNNVQSPKFDKNAKQLPASDRVSRLGEKSPNIAKNQKNKKFMSMHKKTSQQNDTIQNGDKNQLKIQQFSKQEDQLVQSQYIQTEEDKNLQTLNHTAQEEGSHNEENQQNKQKMVKKLEQELNSMNKILQQKNEEIKQLHERIEQLTANVQNLIKKNSQKSQEFNKLHEQNIDLLQKLNQTTKESNLQFEQMKKKLQQLQKEQKQFQLKKINLEKQIQALEQQKNDKIEQQLGRYETAQRFYELTRRDLRQQNENLMLLLQERQNQLTNLYQVIKIHSHRNVQQNIGEEVCVF